MATEMGLAVVIIFLFLLNELWRHHVHVITVRAMAHWPLPSPACASIHLPRIAALIRRTSPVVTLDPAITILCLRRIMDISSRHRHILVLLDGTVVTTRWGDLATPAVVLNHLITGLVVRERTFLALLIVLTPVSVLTIASRARLTLLLLLVILIILIALVTARLVVLLLLLLLLRLMGLPETRLMLLERLLQSVRV